MAFEKRYFQKISSSLNDEQPRLWSYQVPADSSETAEDVVRTTNYFLPVKEEINDNDALYLRARNHDGNYDINLYQFQFLGADIQLVEIDFVPRLLNIPMEYGGGTSGDTYYFPIAWDGAKLQAITLYMNKGIINPAHTYQWRFETVSPATVIHTFNLTHTHSGSLWETFSTPDILIEQGSGLRFVNINVDPVDPALFTGIAYFTSWPGYYGL